ncbi:MAG TPA: DNA-directed RNA polymerase subunit omega [bacterium]|nr:DNA-directed RNA polymerase subunit omega [bacterium]
MSYLALVEEYPKKSELTQFEKVLVAARRAKDLHRGQQAQLVESEHKEPYVALEELREGKIHRVYREEEPAELAAPAAEETEEEDE